jgi:hypothetical protein
VQTQDAKKKMLDKATIGIIVLFILLIIYMTYLTFTSPYPDGRDVWFHIDFARAWFKGTNGMTIQIVMDVNGIPYPPLFHLILAPFCYSQASALLATQFMQLIFYPLGVVLLALLVRKYMGSKTALIFALAITGTYYAFGQMQVKPESLELLFYPVAFWAVMENKTKTFIASTTVMFYTHSPISIALVAGFLIYLFRKNRKDVKVWASIVACAPIILYQVQFIFSNAMLKRWVLRGDLGIINETQQFYANPLFWLLSGLGINLIAFGYLVYAPTVWNKLSEFMKVTLYSLAGMTVIIPIWYQRTMSFATMPFAIITAYLISQAKPYMKPILYMLLIFQVVIFTLMPTWWMNPAPYFNSYW